MSEFLNAYNQLIQNPKSKPQIGTYVLNQGLTALKATYDIAAKEDILLKLLFIYSELPQL